ncbi:hypothetical protein A0H81_06974 [Grifola frondosa]|uniref:Uncharacterized protein n=1 Tax=Grifola frondosa TaxID=5627 RepID=A0A1C7M8G6_GRIFR|nr:hypothetical protein A0H81_06974 [Grifola frondosa]
MGTTKNGNPPEPLKNGRFWTEEDVNSPDRLLRPNWDSWADNRSVWLREVTQLIRDRGPHWSNEMTAEELRDVPMQTLHEAIKAFFETTAKRYKINMHKTESERHEKSRVNRRKARKRTRTVIQKAAERTAHRESIAELRDKKYDFLFTWAYQSTDESDLEGAIDPGTDNEVQNEVPMVVGGRRPWISRAPAYRADGINNLLDRLDVTITAMRELPTVRTTKEKDGQTKPAVKISRTMIDPTWLQALAAKYDKPSFIAPEESDTSAEVPYEEDREQGQRDPNIDPLLYDL